MDFASRYDFLKTLIARYDSYYNLAAVKASLLLTCNAILLAPALSADSPLMGWGTASVATRVLIAIAALACLVSIAFSALVIASYLRGSHRLHEGHSLVFTESVAALPSEDFVNAMAALSQAALLEDLARLANVLARGVVQRFRYINVSLAALMIALLSTVAAILM